MLDWLWRNKEWVFSGVGVALVGAVIALILKRQRGATMHQRSTGAHSPTIQIAGNVIITNGKSPLKPKSNIVDPTFKQILELDPKLRKLCHEVLPPPPAPPRRPMSSESLRQSPASKWVLSVGIIFLLLLIAGALSMFFYCHR
jgi:hypothetical protein